MFKQLSISIFKLRKMFVVIFSFFFTGVRSNCFRHLQNHLRRDQKGQKTSLRHFLHSWRKANRCWGSRKSWCWIRFIFGWYPKGRYRRMPVCVFLSIFIKHIFFYCKLLTNYRYGLFDFEYMHQCQGTSESSKKQKLFLMSWCPDTAKVIFFLNF